ncbi:MAG TPA: porphobilinogen synthase [Candidatus Dormibacteraeota bacterium]|nr:porphobilinogen synthase [Candidatus Dormibacteraeota bacterium]
MTAVLVTRPAGAGDPLVAELEGRGYRVRAIPTVSTRTLDVQWPDLASFDWVVLTSAAGAEALPEAPDGPSWAAVGEATAAALRSRGAHVDFVPSEANGAALAEELPDPSGKRVLLVRASQGDPDLPEGLRRRGALVEEVTAYETVEGPGESSDDLRRALEEPDLAAVVFASGSAVRGFSRLAGPARLPAITIGPRTSAAAREAGFHVIAEAAGASVKELASAVEQAIPAASHLRQRPRRLRTGPAMRALVRETWLHPSQLIAPLFVTGGRDRRQPIESLKGHSRLTPDLALREAHRLAELGVGGVLLFGIPDSKDALGSGADDPRGPVPETLRLLRQEDLPLVLAADVCLCEYTSHGHCGVLDGERVDNDASLPRLASAAVAYGEAGAGVVGPSAMMDGQVGALRAGLDRAGLRDVAIMAYASKHASFFYGPFREAAGSTPSFGDRKSYQMDPANAREAMREMELDLAEGADILMVKPAITSLDLLARARARFDLPLAAYQVSGEAAMIEAAAERGWIDRRGAVLESLTAIVRAGAGIVITYFAADAAAWLRE